jgi:hypothetical protein|tara:strand:+ start:1250 stop:1480 length:231 start_codon:yes stop_codon:yes gene_type:complete
MKYSQEEVDKIYNYTTISDRDKIDKLLQIDATQYTNCGSDSTKKEREIVKKNSTYIYKTIKKINQTLGETFLKHQD